MSGTCQAHLTHIFSEPRDSPTSTYEEEWGATETTAWSGAHNWAVAELHPH